METHVVILVIGLLYLLALLLNLLAGYRAEGKEFRRREGVLKAERRELQRKNNADPGNCDSHHSSIADESQNDVYRELEQFVAQETPALFRGMLRNAAVSYPLFGAFFVLVGVALVAQFLNQNGKVAFACFVIGIICSAVAKFHFHPKALSYAARLSNLRDSLEHRKDIDSRLSEGIPFAIYLRDFWFSSVEKLSQSQPFVGVSTSTRHPSEERIALLLSDWVPLYAFHNHWDSDPYVSTRRILSSDEAWHSDFVRYATNALVIVMDACMLSSGVRQELEWLEETGFGTKTLIVGTDEELDKIAADFPSLFQQIKWRIPLKERQYFRSYDFCLPDTAVDFLARSVGSTRTSGYEYEKSKFNQTFDRPGLKTRAVYDSRPKKED